MVKGKRAPAELPAELWLWFGDGAVARFPGEGKSATVVSVGRTDSERAMGFRITDGDDEIARFVLSRGQVEHLAGFLARSLSGLKRGRKR